MKAWMPTVFLTLSACVTRGQDFASDLSWLKKGQTTQADVAGILGEPFQVGNSSGQITWTYGLYHFRLIGESQTKELKIYWNGEKKVDSYSFTSSFPDDKKRALYFPSHKNTRAQF